jgi:hypothetical protein
VSNILKLELILDLKSFYDKAVVKLLRELPVEQRKEFVISALLYYAKSPSYLMNLKIEEMLSNLNNNGTDEDQRKLILVIQNTVEKTIKSVLKNELKNIRVIGSGESQEEVYSDSVEANDLFDKLAEEIIVE